MNSILFLDFDGVVHPGNRGTFERAPMLEMWLLDHPEVDIVISSSWRIENTLQELRACFNFEEIHARVLDHTPILRDVRYAQRQREIEQWLAEAERGGCRYAALDDDTSGFEPGCPWLVLTSFREGLQQSHLDELERRLCLPKR